MNKIEFIRQHGGITMKLIFSTFLLIFISLQILAQEETWEPVDNNPEARFGASMVTLPDGRVVMFGGQGENDILFNDLNIFRDTWTPPVIPGTEPPPERKNHSAWSFENKMYVYGGAGYSQFYSDLWSYDFLQNSWTSHSPTGDKPEPRECASTFIWNDDLYLVGGQDETGKFSDYWSYNIASDTWTKRGHTPISNAGAAISTYENNLYFLGYSSWTIVLDLNTRQVRDFQSSPMPDPRQNSAFVQFDDIAYLFGGEGSVLQDMWSFDMTTESWTQMDDIPIPLKYASAAVIDNKILLFGGVDDDELINGNAWLYQFEDPTNIISPKTDLPISFRLYQNYPNPFNPTTKIKYSIPVGNKYFRSLQSVILKIYDILGNEVTTLVNETKAPGNYEIEFDASNLSSGVYFYKLTVGGFRVTRKMMILK